MSNSIPDIMKTVTPQADSPTISLPSATTKSVFKTPSLENGGADILKIILIAAIVIFLSYNIYLYLTEGTDVLGKYFGIGLTTTAKTTKDVVDTNIDATKRGMDGVKKGADKSLDMVAETGQKIENKAESRLQDAVNKPPVRPNMTKADISTESNIQNPKQSGYCYIGTDRTYRSCVKMEPGDVCASNKVYPTKDICINPNLRR